MAGPSAGERPWRLDVESRSPDAAGSELSSSILAPCSAWASRTGQVDRSPSQPLGKAEKG
jgi:hypothetical protein